MSHPSVVGDTMLMEKLWRPHADGHFFLVVPFLAVMFKTRCTKYALILLSWMSILYTKVRGEGKFHLPLKNDVFTLSLFEFHFHKRICLFVWSVHPSPSLKKSRNQKMLLNKIAKYAARMTEIYSELRTLKEISRILFVSKKNI